MSRPKEINIDPNSLRDIPCKCGGLLFTQVDRLKHVSRLQSPDGNEGVIRLAGLVCVECGLSDTDAVNHLEQVMKEEFESKVIPLKNP